MQGMGKTYVLSKTTQARTPGIAFSSQQDGSALSYLRHCKREVEVNCTVSVQKQCEAAMPHRILSL